RRSEKETRFLSRETHHAAAALWRTSCRTQPLLDGFRAVDFCVLAMALARYTHPTHHPNWFSTDRENSTLARFCCQMPALCI
ncbi:hypothetical protein, partial [Achromobacter spanius]|uniref:hypothetical protein n=1 Tax=Achromobacter spanius TaxID=217203 RepID=UPI003A902058